jgi:valyl-tRNA synthetase
MINWDPAAETALSDEEVEYKDLQGKLYYVRYKVAGSDEYITIATQRPETIMGDTAVCVNPTDERYQHLKGKKIIVPLVNREVPLIFDDYVDPTFGTGALKVTPAHDINDYNLGLKHNLPAIDTLNPNGTLSEAAEVFVGMDRFEARKASVQQLKEEGALVKEEEYSTRLGFSQRTNVVVEPRISTQWFVKMRGLADKALQAVSSGEVKIHPEERFLATYKYWLENVKDWCISRQLWWGQRIPAWYDKEGRFVVAATEDEAIALFQSTHATTISTGQLTQDEDVLDTWFSSWLWPIEVFNGITQPNNPEINYYYPTSVLVTGQDIIFFWVARMIMAGEEYMHQKPFDDVYFTGMVRDKQGRKMSKSLGNSPDLLDLISRFGADAVRFGILISSPAGNDLLFDDSSCEQGRNFNNKLWNALKLVKMWEANGAVQKATKGDDFEKASLAVHWFETRLAEVQEQLKGMYKEFRLSEALKTIYSLIWDDFCSWYLEWVKPPYGEKIDDYLLESTIDFFEQLMQLLHPFMPFVTEEIYHHLRQRAEGDDLTNKQLGEVGHAQQRSTALQQSQLMQLGSLLKETITAIRDTRAKNNIKPKESVKLHIQTSEQSNYRLAQHIMGKQVNAAEILFTTDVVPNTITVVVGTDKFYLETETEVDPAAQKEQMLKDLEYLKGFLVSVEKKLSNERFVQNAKPEVVEVERKKKADAEDKIKAIEESLASLS